MFAVMPGPSQGAAKSVAASDAFQFISSSTVRQAIVIATDTFSWEDWVLVHLQISRSPCKKWSGPGQLYCISRFASLVATLLRFIFISSK